MKSFVVLLFLLTLPFVVVAQDKLVSYDAATSVLSVEHKGELKTYRVKPTTEFTINGVKAPLAKLSPGMKLVLSLADPQTLSRIAVQLPKMNGRTIILKMRVDGNDIVRIKDGQLTIEHKGWDQPEEISINGIEWKPEWNGGKTEPYKAFDPPLVPFGQANPVVKQVSGRSKVITDRTSQGDTEKALILKYNDEISGSDVYEVHVTW